MFLSLYQNCGQITINCLGRQSGLMLANSNHDPKVVGSNLFSSETPDENLVKAMPESILAPNSGSFDNKKNTGHASKKK